MINLVTVPHRHYDHHDHRVHQEMVDKLLFPPRTILTIIITILFMIISKMMVNR